MAVSLEQKTGLASMLMDHTKEPRIMTINMMALFLIPNFIILLLVEC